MNEQRLPDGGYAARQAVASQHDGDERRHQQGRDGCQSEEEERGCRRQREREVKISVFVRTIESI